MGRFTGGVVVRTGARRRWWRPSEWVVHSAVTYEHGEEPCTCVITVPAGFTFDLSAPWWALWLLPRKRMRRTAALHDWMRRERTHGRHTFSLWFADIVFLDANRAEGLPEAWCVVAWRAVRLSKRRD